MLVHVRGRGSVWLLIDERQLTASLGGRDLRLRRREFLLLAYLIRHRNDFVPRRQILREVWDDAIGSGANSLSVHLSRLRAKLGETPDEPRFLRTCRDRGVMFTGQPAHSFSPNHRLFVPRPPIAHTLWAA
jgi:DNA-binding response OmpR family regulator